jgi:hypothetical protein
MVASLLDNAVAANVEGLAGVRPPISTHERAVDEAKGNARASEDVGSTPITATAIHHRKATVVVRAGTSEGVR